MSKLVLEFQVPEEYDRSDFQDIIKAICTQVNLHAEGRLSGRYAAAASAPAGSAVAYAVSDITWDSNATVRGSIAPGVAANYVRLGWICTVAGRPGTHEEIRVAVGT